jgi:UDP-N-acetylglucosamine 1-carboxyvinyltransferase
MDVTAVKPSDDVAVINGGRKLSGTVELDGFKHGFVMAVAAALMGNHRLRFQAAPRQQEAAALLRILNSIEIPAHREQSGTIVIDATKSPGADFDESLFNSIHGSVYLIPGMLAHRGQATLRPAGGCQIGDGPGNSRPFEHYVEVIERFGGRVIRRSELGISLRAERLRSCDLDMADFAADRIRMSGPEYSGATKFSILCAAAAAGVSTIRQPYPKADVAELLTVLRLLGAYVERLPGGDLRVGPGELWTGSRDVTHVIVPDIIQAMTWLTAGVVTGGSVAVSSPRISAVQTALQPEFEALAAMGLGAEVAGEKLRVTGSMGDIAPVNLEITSRGVYSDVQPFLALLLTGADGTSTLTERVWRRRFSYADGLRDLGCDVSHADGTLTIRGPRLPRVPGQLLRADDLRAAAALVLAALCVDGTTVLTGLTHLARGYQDLPGELRALGGQVEPFGP